MTQPSIDFEKQYSNSGYKFIAGVDEVGRGCLAGPVVAGAVILNLGSLPTGINDSKKLSTSQREKLVPLIEKSAVAFAIGMGSIEEIDSLNILVATKLAMVRALEKLSPTPDFVLVDGNQTLNLKVPQKTIVQGDSRCLSIAAASVLAKVFRDKLMTEYDEQFPEYGFAKHKGYGSVVHRQAMQSHGLTPLHRRSFQWTPVLR